MYFQQLNVILRRQRLGPLCLKNRYGLRAAEFKMVQSDICTSTRVTIPFTCRNHEVESQSPLFFKECFVLLLFISQNLLYHHEVVKNENEQPINIAYINISTNVLKQHTQSSQTHIATKKLQTNFIHIYQLHTISYMYIYSMVSYC